MISIKSTAFINGGHVPDQYGCNGANVNPPLNFYDLPAGTKSLALIVFDPDSPSGHFTHWLLIDIDPSVHTIEENSTPYGAARGMNDFGEEAYGGPCPSFGTHHYHFTLYALDQKLHLPSGTKKTKLDEAMKDHILGQAEFVGTYIKK